MCLYPKFILNRKYLPNKKNEGNPAQVKDERTKYVPVGCGKCMECKKQKSREWQVRLMEEIRSDSKGLFVTLSFSDEELNKLENEIDYKQGYERDNKVATLAVRRYLERWRKEYKTSQKHWLITELGQVNTERIHIHGIMWTNKPIEEIKRIWKYGNVWIGEYVNEKTVNYIIKYCSKTDPKHKYYMPRILTSPGIGRNYVNRNDSKLNQYNEIKTDELYKARNGAKMAMPKYYRNKIYSEEEKEKLWIKLLDKETRYVNGIKIDISKGEQEYYKVLKEQRAKNLRLGYGDGTKDRDQMKYERDQRNIKRLTRLKQEELKRNARSDDKEHKEKSTAKQNKPVRAERKGYNNEKNKLI